MAARWDGAREELAARVSAGARVASEPIRAIQALEA
jgi:hypothetical protein